MSELDKVRCSRFLTLEDAAALHGHLGPFLVIGYRIGLHAVEKLKPKNEFCLEVTAYLPAKTPYTCMLDGLQCSTKCTLGKGNIIHVNSSEMKIAIRHKCIDRTLTYYVKPSFIDRINSTKIEYASALAKTAPISEICTMKEKLNKESNNKLIQIEMIITTTHNVPGYKITKILGIVTGMTCRTRGLGGRILASLEAVAGGKSHAYLSELEKAKNEALQDLMNKASAMGANAVVGVRIEMSEILEGFILITATGTAVQIEPETSQQ